MRSRRVWALLWGLALALRPAAAAPAEEAAAWLAADVEPRSPWVGQPVVLRVRLVLLRDLAEEPAYVPPATTGFWAEAASRPQSYYANVAGRRALVTETRTRLYPLAPGAARIGSATAEVVFARPVDPEEAGGVPREQTLRSAPVVVPVRPLPAGAPEEFEGAVGSFVLAWSADRVFTSQDVPVTVRLDVRGSGNLALLKAPALAAPGAEVLAGAREDSLPSAGSSGAGRVRFQWNVLARRLGPLAVPGPRFAWFDPAAGRYRRAALPALRVEIGPALFSSGPDDDVFPAVFAEDAPDPFARGERPWAWALAGLLVGTAVVLWRARPAPDPLAEERARVAAWRNLLKGAGGTAFWRAAEESVEWLGRAGRPLSDLRERVAAARYGRAGGDAGVVRARLQEALASALPRPRRRAPTRVLAVALLALAVAVVGAVGLGTGEEGGAGRLRAADRAAQEGDAARALGEWVGMWREGARSPALAARLAWGEITAGRVAPATVWVLRGERAGARDGALAWVADLVREGGGLAGARPVRLPVRRVEWSLLALVLGVAAGALWPRRLAAGVAAALSLGVAAVAPLEDAWAGRVAQAVVARAVGVEGSEFQLEPGQVVQVLGRQGEWVRVRIGNDLAGRMPAEVLLPVAEDR